MIDILYYSTSVQFRDKFDIFQGFQYDPPSLFVLFFQTVKSERCLNMMRDNFIPNHIEKSLGNQWFM